AYPDAVAQARDLNERVARALGSGDEALAWGDAAEKSLGGAEVLDVRFTAAYMAPDHGPTQVALGRALLGAGKFGPALETLARGLRLCAPEARPAQLRSIAPAWRLDFAPDAAQAAAAGTAHMRAGRFDAAVPPLWWAWANDPAGQARNLGIALSRTGKAFEATSVVGDARTAAQMFYEARRPDVAARLFDAASYRFQTDEEGAILGRVARLAGDDETAAEAFGRAFHLRNGQLAAGDLAAYATALAAVGAVERCEDAVERARVAAGNDAVVASAAAHALARARLAQGRFPEAAQAAQAAVAQCPIPEVRKEYNDTLQAAQR